MAGGVKIVLKGAREFDRAIDHLIDKVHQTGREIVVEGGAIVAKAAKQEFSTAVIDTKTGSSRVLASKGDRRKGERIVRKGNHVGGSRPHNRTGRLARSIRLVKVEQLGESRWGSSTGPTAAYGRRVELGFNGTDARGRTFAQPPYPYLEPGFSAARPELTALYYRKWGEALHG